jgi:hypothetical protein
MATQEEYKNMSEAEKKKEDWMNSKWRPAMGWMYMLVCFCDMVLFPVAWSILQASLKQPVTQWNPLTLQGAGLFHLAMGAVLGLAAWGRTQEKLNDKAGVTAPIAPTPINTPAVPSMPKPVPKPVVPTTVDAVELEPGDPPTRNTRND